MKSKRTGNTKQKNGQTIHEYSDGCWRYATGGWAERPPQAAAIITTGNGKSSGRSLALRRAELARAKAEARIFEKAEARGLSPADGVDAYAIGVAHMYDRSFDDKSLRAGIEGIKLAGEAIGVRSRGSQDSKPNVLSVYGDW